jgi:hypothetical protein
LPEKSVSALKNLLFRRGATAEFSPAFKAGNEEESQSRRVSDD